MMRTVEKSHTVDEILASAKGKLCICLQLIKDCMLSACNREILYKSF